MRCGASKNTIGPAACACETVTHHRSRSFALTGGNPRNVNPSPSTPEAESAAITALAPGTGSTLIPAAAAAATSLAPGSEIAGVPASETRATDSPRVQAPDERFRAHALVVRVQADQWNADAKMTQQQTRMPGVFSRHDRRLAQHANAPET